MAEPKPLQRIGGAIDAMALGDGRKVEPASARLAGAPCLSVNPQPLPAAAPHRRRDFVRSRCVLAGGGGAATPEINQCADRRILGPSSGERRAGNEGDSTCTSKW